MYRATDSRNHSSRAVSTDVSLAVKTHVKLKSKLVGEALLLAGLTQQWEQTAEHGVSQQR